MTNMDTPVSDRVAQMPQASQMFYNQILQQADENIFTAIKDLRKSQADGSIEPELREAGNLALIAMTTRLNGSQERFKSTAEAVAEIKLKIKEAAQKGDRETFDVLTASLARGQKKASQAAELQQKRSAELEATTKAFAEEQKAKYETFSTEFKDMEIQQLRRQGMNPQEAEAHYQQFSARSIEATARSVSGYHTREPIEDSKLNIEESAIHGAGTG
jgi:hypothetical protein